MAEEETILAPEDVAYLRGRYQHRIVKQGVTRESLRAGTQAKQRSLHAVHAAAISRPDMLVLDIGCGLGHFYRFLQERGLRCTYHGYDLVPEYVAACKTRYPDGQFHERVFPRDAIEGQYDVIVLSQVLNVRLLHSDNMRVLERVLALAFEHARHCVSVDLLSSYVDFREDHLFYYEPEAFFRLAKRLTRRVSLRHDPHPFEFCIQLFREVSEPST